MHVKHSDTKQYMFDSPGVYKTQHHINKVLEIDNTAIAPQFSGIYFVYRTSSTHYLTDHYHYFFNPPAQQINQIVTNYLGNTGLFNYVTNDDDYEHAHYTLHTKILDLYADYRNRQKPKGIITIQFTLFQHSKLETKIVMNKTFRETIPLQAKNSDALINAWNQGLENILKKLTQNLSRVV